MAGEAPTTELEAVNEMLLAIGEAPINTLSEPGFVDAQIAIAQLRRTSREVQGEGWQFNREPETTLLVDVNGNINLTSNTIGVYPDGRDSYRNLTVRGGKLYDIEDKTFTFTDPVSATVVYFLPFDQLPEPARNYITIRAARRYQDKMLGDDNSHVFDQADEDVARASLLSSDLSTGPRPNMLSDNPSFARLKRYRRRF